MRNALENQWVKCCSIDLEPIYIELVPNLLSKFKQ